MTNINLDKRLIALFFFIGVTLIIWGGTWLFMVAGIGLIAVASVFGYMKWRKIREG